MSQLFTLPELITPGVPCEVELVESKSIIRFDGKEFNSDFHSSWIFKPVWRLVDKPVLEWKPDPDAFVTECGRFQITNVRASGRPWRSRCLVTGLLFETEKTKELAIAACEAHAKANPVK